MSLRDDVNAGLAAVSRASAPQPLVLDDAGWCGIPVPMPPSVIELADGQIMLEVQISKTQDFFTFSSPLAVVKSTPSARFSEALLRRQFYADHVSGAGFALAVVGDEDLLVSVYHWMLDSITPEQFRALFKKFIGAVFDHVEEINTMARREFKVKPIHKGRP